MNEFGILLTIIFRHRLVCVQSNSNDVCKKYLLPWTKKKKKNHHGDASCDFEESAVWFRCDASMREVAAVASCIRSRFHSWIKHPDSSISQDSDFMHQQHGSFFFLSRVVYAWLCLTANILGRYGNFDCACTTLAKKKRPLRLCIKSEHCSYHAISAWSAWSGDWGGGAASRDFAHRYTPKRNQAWFTVFWFYA